MASHNVCCLQDMTSSSKDWIATILIFRSLALRRIKSGRNSHNAIYSVEQLIFNLFHCMYDALHACVSPQQVNLLPCEPHSAVASTQCLLPVSPVDTSSRRADDWHLDSGHKETPGNRLAEQPSCKLTAPEMLTPNQQPSAFSPSSRSHKGNSCLTQCTCWEEGECRNFSVMSESVWMNSSFQIAICR